MEGPCHQGRVPGFHQTCRFTESHVVLRLAPTKRLISNYRETSLILTPHAALQPFVGIRIALYRIEVLRLRLLDLSGLVNDSLRDLTSPLSGLVYFDVR